MTRVLDTLPGDAPRPIPGRESDGLSLPSAAPEGAAPPHARELEPAGRRESPSLIGLSPDGFDQILRAVGVPDRQLRMRRQQFDRWLYVHGATSFDQMTNISRPLRTALASQATLARPEIVAEQISNDGTRKWLLRLAGDGTSRRPPEVETVYIPESDRGTLCISSQVGCTLTCSFCHTGTQRLVRNLTAGEILAQIFVARDRLGDWPGGVRPNDGLVPESERAITNIVLMGMGEPLYNFDNVRDAMLRASDGDGLGISRRRITLSTSGVVPEIGRWGEEAGTMLAISLHAVRDALRDELVPINRKWPIAELLAACRDYPGLSNAKRITFEYVMLKDVNDSLADARELVRLLAGIPAKINLIPFNPWPGSPYECSSWEQIERFAEVVNRAGYASPVRTPRGRDIMAACGQLKSASERLSARARRASESAAGDPAS
ncbi:MAG: 23S rRNA (adenine(2503)-C(2))-methyltransferase RlmN [Rhizobiales bacterium]|nr:23S rRNA (adenine(2503)-C(2))-methyltransferase RlmN [Hyphomicrobiales bacterium]